MTKPVVVDTNVPLTANGKAKTSPECVISCIDALVKLLSDQQPLVIDDGWRILNEYKKKLSQTGQPRVGDRFLKWVLTNLANPSRCIQVPITPRRNDETHFLEFPNDPALSRFDRADRKFVAVARAHSSRPPILQALDSKWWGWKEPLKRAGVTVHFLCLEEIAALYEQKFGKTRRKRSEKPFQR